jgi:hypothetical protein
LPAAMLWWGQGKIETIATQIYRAGQVTYSDLAEEKIKRFSKVVPRL